MCGIRYRNMENSPADKDVRAKLLSFEIGQKNGEMKAQRCGCLCYFNESINRGRLGKNYCRQWMTNTKAANFFYDWAVHNYLMWRHSKNGGVSINRAWRSAIFSILSINYSLHILLSACEINRFGRNCAAECMLVSSRQLINLVIAQYLPGKWLPKKALTRCFHYGVVCRGDTFGFCK